MSKEHWFREYERLWHENEAIGAPQTEGQLAQRARELQLQKMLEQADLAREEEKHK